MKSLKDLLYIDQKIGILQAADDFKFQLDKAQAEFDYTAALATTGVRAIGVRYYYEVSVSLLNWIYNHPVFVAVMQQHIQSGYRDQLGRHFGNPQTSFFNLQQVTASLLSTLINNLCALDKASNQGFVCDAKFERSFGIDILRTVKNAKTEQACVDLFVTGFGERYPPVTRR